MCSNCSGDYEDPEITQWPDRESTEQEALEAIELGAIEEMIEDFNAEPIVPDPALEAVRDYLAAVKRYGKALVDLGRSCDKP